MILTDDLGRTGFASRREAGRQLADRLAAYRTADAVVLALPRGGVPVAAEVARALGAPLGLALVRKLGAPSAPELAVGAIGEGGVSVLAPDALARSGITAEAFAGVVVRETAELARRALRYRGDVPPLDLVGRVAILVDDGIATGATARAAIRSARARGAAAVVLAAGVATPDVVDALADEADQVVAVLAPDRLGYVGAWFDDFRPVSDGEVIALLQQARRTHAACGPEAPRRRAPEP